MVTVESKAVHARTQRISRAILPFPLVDLPIAFLLAAVATTAFAPTQVSGSAVTLTVVLMTISGALWGVLTLSVYGPRRGGIANQTVRSMRPLELRQVKAMGTLYAILLATLTICLVVNFVTSAESTGILLSTCLLLLFGSFARFAVAQSSQAHRILY